MDTNRIYNQDCVQGLKQLDSESVDLVVTSPPYDNLRAYNGYSFDFESTAKELYRVIKKGGVVVWVIADQTKNGSESGSSFRQALYFKEIGFNLHDTMIWQKPNPIPLTHNRYEQAFEYMFVFSKGKPKAFNPILEKCLTVGNSLSLRKAGKVKNSAKRSRKETEKTKETKYHKNIFIYNIGSGSSEETENHPAPYPEQLAYDQIITWSNQNDVVLDPFMGSGTTAKMCLKTNRKYIGFEISKEYCDIAQRRVQDISYQINLFDLTEDHR